MKVLVLNSGSSSIKFQLFEDTTWGAIASGAVSRIGEDEGEVSYRWTDPQGQQHSGGEGMAISNHRDGIERIVAGLQASGVLADLSELAAIGHRVVHGGERFHRPTVVDDAVAETIRDMIPLAPLHNPANLDGIEVARKLFPGVPSVAVFDTAFHQTMPSTAYRYAIPEFLYREHRVRRYGFHGTSHHYVAERAASLLDRPFGRCNLITLHLGNGASATAIRGGQSVDTSMGMTPLEGLVMGSRCGDLDPAIHFYLSHNLGLTVQDLDDLLNRQSGLLGICGVNDMREIHRLAGEGNERAELAIGITALRIRKYIGAYYAELGRVDAIVFTGGIGENDPEIRRRACSGLDTMGIVLDERANLSRERGERTISAADSLVKVMVIPTNEELAIARQALAAVS
jgi:acetate kinase